MKQETIQANFTHNIKLLRRVNNLSQSQLADALEIKRSKLGAWEEGRCLCNVEMLLKICSKFHLTSMEDLLLHKIPYNKVEEI